MIVLIRRPSPCSVGDPVRVDDEQAAALGDRAASCTAAGQARPTRRRAAPGRFSSTVAPGVGPLEHVEAVEEAGVVHGDELGPADLVGRADRCRARTAGATPSSRPDFFES